MRKSVSLLMAAGLGLWGANSVRATLIASDSFLTTNSGTGNTYSNGATLQGQAPTSGTTGYYTGSPSGNQQSGWVAGTSSFQCIEGGMTNSLVVDPPTSNDGLLFPSGVGSLRFQHRDLATASPLASANYFFSAVIQESSRSYTGTAYIGLGPAESGANSSIIPNGGFGVGFANGAISLFYNNGSAVVAQTLLGSSSTTATTSYLVEIATSGSGSSTTLIPSVYAPSGALINNPATGTVIATLNASIDLGAFQSVVSADFPGNSTSIYFDEPRFGTAAADVVAPEPTSLSVVVAGSLVILGRPRRAGRSPILCFN